MIHAQGTIGRVFVLRLEDGDSLPGSLEDFARNNGVARAVCLLIGGVGSGRLVVGPEDGGAERITPMVNAIQAVHEAAAVGTIFPDESGAPRLHMHTALGRGDSSMTGCVRQGVDIWKLAEVVMLEIKGADMVRAVDPAFGFEVLSAKKAGESNS
ncbi:MAG: PPC domain-containing DNA-binding protein [Oceanidesulfovibrio sp.]